LFNHRVSDQNFDTWHERAILKRRHRDGVDVSEIVRLYRPDVIAKATREREAEDCRK